MRSRHVRVTVNLGQIRANACLIAKSTAVDLIAVVKADAYGLGAAEVVKLIGDVVSGWCVFSPEEAKAVAAIDERHKPILVLGPSNDADPTELAAANIHPAVWTVEEAARLRVARPILSVDTGMKRFACPAEKIDAVIAAGNISEAFTHATGEKYVRRLLELVGNKGLRLHAAASALLDETNARLNAVRPGLALYRGAARVSTRLLDLHIGGAPAGYTGFVTPRFGVVLCGYNNGLRRGVCTINNVRRAILEVGMQSAYVETGPDDREGDEVTLLGEGLSEAEVGQASGITPHAALVALSGAGERVYVRE